MSQRMIRAYSPDITDLPHYSKRVKLAVPDTTNSKDNANDIQVTDSLIVNNSFGSYSSEFFKIQVTNLPSPLSYPEARRLIQEKLKLNAKKVKLADQPPSIFATFENAEMRDLALETVNGYTYRQKELVGKVANPTGNICGDPISGGKITSGVFTDAELEEKVLLSVAPYQNIPYQSQLERKRTDLVKIVKDIIRDIVNVNSSLKSASQSIKLEVPTPLESPKIDGYRNKAEFTIGKSPSGEKVVGYRGTAFKLGCVNVGSISKVKTLPYLIISTARDFESFVRYSRYHPYDPVTHSGLFRTLTIRQTIGQEIMAYLTITGGILSDDGLTELTNSMRSYFNSGHGHAISSCYIKSSECNGQKERNVPILVFGKPTITESLLGLKFQISPDAFFQVNTYCAETLYREIANLAELDSNTTLLDVCCGTGTIGISCLKIGSVGQVIGIELCHSAVQDAKLNAEINNYQDKCEFYCGRAEDLIDAAINMARFENLVAVVDPPRAGLASSVISVLRKSRKIKKIIFVACKLEASKPNFVSFARPRSKKFQGEIFVPTKLIPIDMFPHTSSVECIVLLKRLDKV